MLKLKSTFLGLRKTWTSQIQNRMVTHHFFLGKWRTCRRKGWNGARKLVIGGFDFGLCVAFIDFIFTEDLAFINRHTDKGACIKLRVTYKNLSLPFNSTKGHFLNNKKHKSVF